MAVGEKSRAPRSETYLHSHFLQVTGICTASSACLLVCLLVRSLRGGESFDEVGAVRIKGHVKTFDDPETHLHTGTEQL